MAGHILGIPRHEIKTGFEEVLRPDAALGVEIWVVSREEYRAGVGGLAKCQRRCDCHRRDYTRFPKHTHSFTDVRSPGCKQTTKLDRATVLRKRYDFRKFCVPAHA